MRANTNITQILQASFSIAISQSTGVLTVSDGIYDLLGFYVDDFLSGKVTLQSRIHPDDQDIADALFSNDVNPISSSFNIRLRQADGHIRCVKGQYTKRINNAEKYVTLEILLQDAKSLWEDQGDQTMMANFKAMMDNTDDYIYFKDSNHVFTGASETLVDITEPSEHWMDLIGKTDYDVFPEAFADIYYSLEKQVFAGVDVAHKEQETLDGDGNKGWVDNRKYPIKNDAGNIVGLFGIARDITDSKRIEYDLKEKEERFSLAVTSNGVGIWDLNLLTSELVWDDSMFTVFNIKREDFSGAYEAWEKTLHPDDLLRARHEIEDGISGKKTFDTDFRILGSNGDIRHIKALAKVFHDKDGKPIRMLGTNMDITEIKTAEAELIRYKEHLEEEIKLRTADLIFARDSAESANKAKSEFLSSMSHELRTPLNAILGFGQILKLDSDPSLSEDQKENVDYILSSGKHLLNLINDVLELSTIEGGKLMLSIENIDLIDVMKDTLSLLQPITMKANIQLQLKTNLALVVLADYTKLKQVLINLISNAIKYNKPNGSVTVEWSKTADNKVIITVTDTGIGIPKDQYKKVFGAFNRLGQEQSDIEGTGIGLVVTKNIIEMMGGTIGFDSVEEQGSTFWIEIPLGNETKIDLIDETNETINT